MDHTGGCKDSQYTPAMADLIVRRMLEGESVRRIAADPALPSYATIFHWRRLHPDFAQAWEVARVMRAYLRIERLKAKPARTRPGGKTSSFTVERGEAVCELLRQGIAMSAINAMPGMPSSKVVYTWLRTQPRFREMVGEARRYGLGWLAFQAELTAEKAMPSRKDGRLSFPAVSRSALKAEIAYFEGQVGLLTPKIYGRFRE